jgi:cell division protein FtsL
MHPIAVSIVAGAFFILAILLLGVAIRVRRCESEIAKLRARISHEPEEYSEDDDSDDDLERAGVTVKKWSESMK